MTVATEEFTTNGVNLSNKMTVTNPDTIQSYACFYNRRTT